MLFDPGIPANREKLALEILTPHIHLALNRVLNIVPSKVYHKLTEREIEILKWVPAVNELGTGSSGLLYNRDRLKTLSPCRRLFPLVFSERE